jgi:hypothetical protein
MLEIQPTVSTRFKDLDSLRDYAQDEHEYTKYVPISNGLLTMNDDKYIYNGHDFLHFNEHGLKSLFSAIGINGLFPCMMATEEPSVSTDFINKLLKQDKIRQNLSNKQLIINNTQVIGVVSLQYNRYSNHKFLEDFVSHNETANTIDFERGMVKNTKMSLNWLDKEYTGVEIDGKLDRSRIGFYSGNSMVGDAPIGSALSVFDTLCTNGMKLKTNISSMRIVHRGSMGMKWRMQKMMEETRNQYLGVKERLETLLRIPFEDHTAERLLSSNAPLSIIPELKEKKLWHTKKKFNSPDDSVRDLRRSIGVVQHSPIKYGGVHTQKIWDSTYRKGKRSMYHFIGAFTEFAQTQSPDVQYQIEEEAGDLTTWIHKNKAVLLN